MARASKPQLGWLTAALAVLTLAISVAMIIIINSDLWYGSWWGRWGWSYSSSGSSVCLMNNTSANLCSYGWVVGGVGIIASVFVAFMMCATARRGGGRAMGAILTSVFMILWWLPFAVVATVYGIRADDAGVVESDSRTAVWALAWTALGLWVITLLTAVGSSSRAQPQAPVYMEPPTGGYGPTPNVVYGNPAYYPGGAAAPPPGGIPPPYNVPQSYPPPAHSGGPQYPTYPPQYPPPPTQPAGQFQMAAFPKPEPVV